MKQGKYKIGIAGPGVTGSDMPLNITEHGFTVAGCDKNANRNPQFANGAGHLHLQEAENIADYVATLREPRALMMFTPERLFLACSRPNGKRY